MALETKTRRLQVTLSSKTVAMIDALLREGYSESRSAFLNAAALYYADRLKRAQLKRTLRAGYKARAERDRDLAQAWEPAGSEALWDE